VPAHYIQVATWFRCCFKPEDWARRAKNYDLSNCGQGEKFRIALKSSRKIIADYFAGVASASRMSSLISF
jgi:hypothetical protein